jgi:hypothetical protein
MSTTRRLPSLTILSHIHVLLALVIRPPKTYANKRIIGFTEFFGFSDKNTAYDYCTDR